MNCLKYTEGDVQYRIKRYKQVSIILLTVTFLCYATELLNAVGYVMLVASMLVLLSCRSWKITRQESIVMVLVTGALTVLVVYTIYTGQDSSKLHIMVSTYGISFSVYAFTQRDKISVFDIGESDRSLEDYILDAIVYINSIWMFYELVKFTLFSMSNWANRRAASLWTFPGNMSYVDFGIVGIFAVLIALKRHKRLLAILLSISIFIVVPGRTFRLFILLLAASLAYMKIKNRIRLNKGIWKWTVFLIVAILCFSVIWCYVLVDFFPIALSHQSLYDFSNFFRFKANLYSIGVIIKDKLLFWGLSQEQQSNYTDVFPNFLVKSSALQPNEVNGPHNSYLSLVLFFGVIPSIILLYMLGEVLKRNTSEYFFMIYVLPYLLICCILHDMLVDVRLMAILAVWILPEPGRRQKPYTPAFGHIGIRETVIGNG